MCTSIIEIARAEGMAKRGNQWFPLSQAVVAYDHAGVMGGRYGTGGSAGQVLRRSAKNAKTFSQASIACSGRYMGVW